ncbi:MAG: glycosyltransferase family 4 protein [Thermoplasmatota archaeon]
MKVLLTAHRFYPHVGGTEEVVARLARGLAERGHDVTVATSREPDTPETERHDGYAIRRFDLARVGKFRVAPRAYRDFVLAGAWDVVHLHGQRVWSTDWLYRHFAKARAPLVFTAHGFYQWEVERTPLVDAWYYRRTLPRALRHVAKATALTEHEWKQLVGWGVPATSVEVIPDGFEPREFAAPPARGGFRERHGLDAKRPLVLYAGGSYPNKQVARIVEVAALVGSSAQFVLAGKDADGGFAAAAAAGKARHLDLHVLGVLPRDELLAALADADVFLLASSFEGFALVLLEAMASGLPFVSTPVGAAPDLAKLGAGLVADASPVSLAARVRELLDDETMRRAIGERGREAVADFAWDKIVSRYAALYEEVARR